MKREIKFRVWDDHNMWFEGRNGDYFLTTADMLKRPDVELMQFTGLKDRNGVDIYEGDLLIEEPADPDAVVEVEYRQKSACFCIRQIPNPIWLGATHAFYRVIGNIYENPELIETQPQAATV